MVSLSVRACDSVTLGRLYRTRGLGSLSVTRRARPMITYLKQLGIRKYQSGHVRTRVGPRCHNVNRQRPRIPAVQGANDRTKVQSRTANTRQPRPDERRSRIKDHRDPDAARHCPVSRSRVSAAHDSHVRSRVGGTGTRRGRRPAARALARDASRSDRRVVSVSQGGAGAGGPGVVPAEPERRSDDCQSNVH